MTPPSPGIPSEIGPYVVSEEIGRGGSSRVYRAVHRSLGRAVAIKVLDIAGDEAPEMRARMRREMLLLAGLHHPRIVRIHDAGELPGEGAPYIVMELIEGETIQARVSRLGRLAPQEVLDIEQDLHDALRYLHERGIVHRDVKPANVIRDPEGRVRLMDLGLARFLDSTHLTGGGYVVGTLSTMAPEVLRGEDATPASDLWSLGCLLYHCVTGVTPLDVIAVRQVAAGAEFEIVPCQHRVPSVPSALALRIGRLLDPDPSVRTRAALDSTREPTRTGTSGALRRSAAPPPSGMPRAGKLVLVLSVVLLITLGIRSWSPPGSPEPPHEVQVPARIGGSPGVPETLLHRAGVLERTGDLSAARDTAIKALEEQIRIRRASRETGTEAAAGFPGQKAQFQYQLARIYLKLGRHREALEVIQEVIDAWPRDCHALLIKGLALDGAGRTQESIPALREACFEPELGPEHIRQAVGRLRDSGHILHAADQLKELVRRDPGRADAWELLAGLMIETGRPHEATRLLELARSRGVDTGPMRARLERLSPP